jgi:Ni/Fe-hydrogenase subunit HybB-like protein
MATAQTHAQAHAKALPFRLSPAKMILWGLLLLGIVSAAIRFIYGMGAISNLSNEYSWGIWISLDLLCGVALAAGAFTTCGAVEILGQKQFKPLMRPAVLTGFLGYLAVIIALLVDLGRPERIWHMIIYWNPESPLFEVGLCVMTYTTVLFFEFSPMLWEWLGWKKAEKAIHSISLVFIVLGVLLSTAHQSSLGSLFLVMANKVNPLWHSPIMSLQFFVSAATAGLAMVIFESTIAAKAYGRHQETALLSRLAKAIPWMLGLYLAMKIGDLAYAGELGLTLQPGRLTIHWWIEILGGVVVPMIILAIPTLRRKHAWLFTSATLVIAGLMFNRFNVGLLSWHRVTNTPYFPNWMEFAVSFGVISGVILVYDFVATHMKLFDVGAEEHETHQEVAD